MSLNALDEEPPKEPSPDKLITIVLVIVALILAIFIYTTVFSSEPVATTRVTSTTTTSPSTTSSTTSTSTSSSTTTSSTTSSTTTLPIECYSRFDCGDSYQRRACHLGDVYLETVKPDCRNPGTPEAKCITIVTYFGQSTTTQAQPVEYCENGCENGECL